MYNCEIPFFTRFSSFLYNIHILTKINLIVYFQFFNKRIEPFSKEHGLVFRSFMYLFRLVQQRQDLHFVLKASFLEIYNEKVIYYIIYTIGTYYIILYITNEKKMHLFCWIFQHVRTFVRVNRLGVHRTWGFFHHYNFYWVHIWNFSTRHITYICRLL